MPLHIDFIEMFAGVGGFRYGLEKANLNTSTNRRSKTYQKREYVEGNRYNAMGKDDANAEKRRFSEQPHRSGKGQFTCVWANDNDRYACRIYRKNFGDKELVEGDIRSVDSDTIPDHVLLTAGFPCQSFSVAGKRLGFQDTRGTLFHEICRVAEAKRPPLLLLENVRGLLSHDEGLTFQVILESLEELGYWCEWQVLNSKHYGVPQNRKRVFIIGHLRGSGGREVFPVTEADRFVVGAQEASRRAGSRLRTANPLGVGGSFGERNLIANTLSHRYGKDGSENLIGVKGVTLANTSRYNQGVNRTPLKQDDSSFALNSAGDQGVLQNKRIRRLTPVECERLQGFPDNWTQGVSDTQRYKMLGNAVTTNVIAFLGERIQERVWSGGEGLTKKPSVDS